MLANDLMHQTEVPGWVRRERVLDRKSHYVLASLVVMCVTVAFYPITVPAEMTSNELNASRIIELGLLMMAATMITVAVIHRRCGASFVSYAPLIASLFGIWAVLSCIWSSNPILSFARGMTLLLLLYIAAALAAYIRDISANNLRAVLIIMTTALLGSIAILVLSSWVIWGTPLKFSEAMVWSGREGRLFFAHAGPLESGGLLGVAITAVAFGTQRLGARILIIGGLFVLLLMTNARNLIVIVPFAIAVAVFQRGSTRLRATMVAAAICGFVALLVVLFSGEITDAIPRDLWTLNGRTPLWTKSARHVVESPFLGVGYYTSRYLLMDSQFYAGHAHNSYVDTLLTTGLVGLSLLLVFLAYCLKVSLIAKNAFLTSMLVICGLGSIFNPLILVTNLYTFYLFLIVLVVAENAARGRPASANVSLTISQSAAIQR